MKEALLESKIAHHKTKNPYVLLKQKGKKFYIDILDYKGKKYEPLRKRGIYSDVDYFNNYESAHTAFISVALRYESN